MIIAGPRVGLCGPYGSLPIRDVLRFREWFPLSGPPAGQGSRSRQMPPALRCPRGRGCTRGGAAHAAGTCGQEHGAPRRGEERTWEIGPAMLYTFKNLLSRSPGFQLTLCRSCFLSCLLITSSWRAFPFLGRHFRKLRSYF